MTCKFCNKPHQAHIIEQDHTKYVSCVYCDTTYLLKEHTIQNTAYFTPSPIAPHPMAERWTDNEQLAKHLTHELDREHKKTDL